MSIGTAALLASRGSRLSARLSALERPACSSAWTTATAGEGSGRSAHTASTGLLATATSSPPFFASALLTASAQPREWSQAS